MGLMSTPSQAPAQQKPTLKSNLKVLFSGWEDWYPVFGLVAVIWYFNQ